MTTVSDRKTATISRAPARTPAPWVTGAGSAWVAFSTFLVRASIALRAPFSGREGAARESTFVSVRPSSVSPWTAPPPSLQALHRYTADGEWVPGERAPVLEFLGRAYGWGVSIPVHAALYALLWVLERPTRFGLAVLLAAAVWWTS